MDGSVAIGIRKIIAEKGMRQKVVAERAGFTDQQFSDMLNGRKVIRAEYVLPIAKALMVDITELFSAGQNDGEV